MTDLIEVSYTGDILAHRRCARAWAYEKKAQFHPYEQVQAMEGRLLHHAMEWLARRYAEKGIHATRSELDTQLNAYFRVLWARGIKTAFTSKQDTLKRVADNLFPGRKIHPTVKALIEGAQHSEYELRTVRKVLPADYGGKSRVLLTGVIDLVVQQQSPLTYYRTWSWTDRTRLEGAVSTAKVKARSGDLEIWDYKGTRSSSVYLTDYVRQVVTYAALFKERAGTLPRRCVLFFINEPVRKKQLLAVDIDDGLVGDGVSWTQEQVRRLQQTVLEFEREPLAIAGGDLTLSKKPLGSRIPDELKQQCTACGRRYDCDEYRTHLGHGVSSRKRLPRDIDPLDVFKN